MNLRLRTIKLLAIFMLICLLAVLGTLPKVKMTHAQDATDSPTRPLATIPPTNTPRAKITAAPAITATPAATQTPIAARLCSDCVRIRLRSTPGTAGDVLAFLDSNAQFMIIGRTADNMWVKITLASDAGDTSDSKSGWIAAQYVRSTNLQKIDEVVIGGLPVLDVAVAAPPTATSSVGVPSWMSGVTAHARQIYLHGQSLGNHPNVFSRVGDSISFSPYFLTPIGQGSYQLGAYGSLSGVIGYFSQGNARTGNSFANQSLAAGGGWNSNTLLIPGYSAPQLCGKDSPLVCEYKLVKPAVALIMVGTNDSGSGSTDQFAGNLRQIVQTSIDMGVVPVISTIPPKRIDQAQTDRVNAFNAVIHAVAQQYDIPLWDYWAAMQNAPNMGMSSDGLHPSVPPDKASCNFTTDNLQYGYTIRNLTALQALDVIWRLVLY
ncbi:MAG: GDSL-type esterase/lipase family protein [Chloroflexota bacterium]